MYIRGDDMFIAHIRKSDHQIQSLQVHLKEVSDLCYQNGKSLGIAHVAKLAGYLHDMGKYTTEFSEYIKKSVINGERIAPYIDHSTAGAKYLYENYFTNDLYRHMTIEIVGMSILSHHSGLHDFLSIDGGMSAYLRRVSEKELDYYDEVVDNFESVDGNKCQVNYLIEKATDEIEDFFLKIKENSEKQKDIKSVSVMLSYLQKLVFSILIDADRTNSRQFEEDIVEEVYDSSSIYRESYSNLINQLEKWKKDSPSKIDILRDEMSKKCDELAESSSQIWRLSIPTGGGKTLASLRYALKHSYLYDKQRIIYVVPYTTILEQNAEAVRKYFSNPTDVLEHHANVIDDKDALTKLDYYGDDVSKKLELGRDNWNHPVIFTTMVQYLDVFFAKGTRKTRRLHHLSNSVVVFDEVQSVPLKHQELFNTTINFLAEYCQTSVILCTATQPEVNQMEYPIHLKDDSEMVPNLNEVVYQFERVRFHNKVVPHGFDTNELGEFIEEISERHQSILIILNTKKAVLELFERLSSITSHKVRHLSTSMCPRHRTDILADINKALNAQEKVICVSTQLIEAGVDISFEAVVRSLAGLDSIAQAAGRCNRNAEREKGDVYIIKNNVESLSKLPEIKIGATTTYDQVFTQMNFLEDLLQPSMIKRYFSFFYHAINEEKLFYVPGLDRPLIYYLNTPCLYKKNKKTVMMTMYATVEKYFKAIDSPTTAIIVPYGDRAKEIISDLNEEQNLTTLNDLMKEAQSYVVNVYDHTLNQLIRENFINVLYNNSLYVLSEDAYHKDYGISISGDGEKSTSIF